MKSPPISSKETSSRITGGLFIISVKYSWLISFLIIQRLGTLKHAKFAVYDRFGYGYSDITNEKRDIDVIVNEIHELLIKSGQKPPYIFVGHSLASLETIRYAQKYKNEVKGIVLIDGGNPELYATTKPQTVIGIFQRQLIRFGIARVLYKSNSFADSLNSERNELKLLPVKKT